ncbi:unnamed protein product [Rhizophagus irregularis]|nr:unnamed protein product [Rhizophagus irregularis]
MTFILFVHIPKPPFHEKNVETRFAYYKYYHYTASETPASGSKNHESLTNDFINYEIPDKFSFNNRQVNGDNVSCQIISEPDHTFPKSNDFENKYLEISNYILIESKQGRIPRWYTFLKDKITLQSLQSNTGRLNIDLGHNLIQNSRVQRPRPPPVQPDPITHKGKASDLQPGPTLLQTLYIKLLTSTHFAKHCSRYVSRTLDTGSWNQYF